MNIKIEQITYQLAWQIRHEVMWPNEPLAFIQLDKDPEGLHYGLFDQNRLWFVVSVYLEDTTAQFRKFATRTERQGKGYGTALLNYMLEDIKTFGAQRIWCNARADKLAFYEKFGMIATHEKYEKKGIQFVIMTKEL